MTYSFDLHLSTHKSVLLWNFEVLCSIQSLQCAMEHSQNHWQQQSTILAVIIMLWKSKKEHKIKHTTMTGLLLQMRTCRARILWLSMMISIDRMKELYIHKIMLNAIDVSKSNSCSVVTITFHSSLSLQPCLTDLPPVQILLRNILLPLFAAAVTHRYAVCVGWLLFIDFS